MEDLALSKIHQAFPSSEGRLPVTVTPCGGRLQGFTPSDLPWSQDGAAVHRDTPGRGKAVPPGFALAPSLGLRSQDQTQGSFFLQLS